MEALGLHSLQSEGPNRPPPLRIPRCPRASRTQLPFCCFPFPAAIRTNIVPTHGRTMRLWALLRLSARCSCCCAAFFLFPRLSPPPASIPLPRHVCFCFLSHVHCGCGAPTHLCHSLLEEPRFSPSDIRHRDTSELNTHTLEVCSPHTSTPASPFRHAGGSRECCSAPHTTPHRSAVSVLCRLDSSAGQGSQDDDVTGCSGACGVRSVGCCRGAQRCGGAWRAGARCDPR